MLVSQHVSLRFLALTNWLVMLVRSGRYETEQVSKYLKTIKTWARFGRKLYFKDARGHVLRTAIPLKFPISGSNDVVLILRNYIRQVSSQDKQHPHMKLLACLCTGSTPL